MAGKYGEIATPVAVSLDFYVFLCRYVFYVFLCQHTFSVFLFQHFLCASMFLYVFLYQFVFCVSLFSIYECLLRVSMSVYLYISMFSMCFCVSIFICFLCLQVFCGALSTVEELELLLITRQSDSACHVTKSVNDFLMISCITKSPCLAFIISC